MQFVLAVHNVCHLSLKPMGMILHHLLALSSEVLEYTCNLARLLLLCEKVMIGIVAAAQINKFMMEPSSITNEKF